MTSHFQKDLSSSVSSSRHRVFSIFSATRPELPLVVSLKLSSSRTGLPKLKAKLGLQIEAFLGWSPPTSLEVTIDVSFLDCSFPAQASLAGSW